MLSETQYASIPKMTVTLKAIVTLCLAGDNLTTPIIYQRKLHMCMLILHVHVHVRVTHAYLGLSVSLIS